MQAVEVGNNTKLEEAAGGFWHTNPRSAFAEAEWLSILFEIVSRTTLVIKPDTRDGAGSNAIHVKDHAAWSRCSLLDPLDDV